MKAYNNMPNKIKLNCWQKCSSMILQIMLMLAVIGLFYSIIMAGRVLNECEDIYSAPPSGYVLITDGKFFRWKEVQ